jgi:hypothetical protein
MDQYLHFGRLNKVMSKFWFEERRALLLLFGAIAAFLTILMLLYYSFTNPNLFTPRFQVAYYFFGLFISGVLSASFLFSDLRNKPRAIAYLLLPVAQLEKFVCVLFYGVIVFFIGYSIIFTVVDWIFVTLSNIKFGKSEPVINILIIDRYENPFLDQPSSIMFYIYFILHALFILGSIYFSRYGFFKTLIILLVLWLLFFATTMIIFQFLPHGVFASSLSDYEVFDFRGSIFIDLPRWFMTIMEILFGYLITLGLWAAAYFRLTERQIG